MGGVASYIILMQGSLYKNKHVSNHDREVCREEAGKLYWEAVYLI